MDISYKWLQRFIDVNMSPRELAAVLTSVGLECDTVEEVESIKGGLRGIVIGKVLTCEEHPNSDHLHITTVDLGEPEPVQIVCGAPNVAAGQTVVVATVGTTLYDGDKEFKIKKSKIRGVESLGMICAEDEIGVGESHDGIMVLEGDVPAPGTPAAEYFKLESDYRLEVELTPNRVDAASHLGVARDLKAYYTRTSIEHNGVEGNPHLRMPDVSGFSIDNKEGGISVEVEDPAGCPRYSGITMRGVKVAESPEWLRNLLIAAGQRPVNNIVDITNFILLGIGQPLHCFDLDKLKGGKIIVGNCPDKTKFTTLDGKEHELNEADLMIKDAEGPAAMAGVFGGLESGVTDQTANIFIESAYFNPTRVRRTARRHGLSTDASFRYERGTDPAITIYAARVAACLIREIAGGEICGDIIDVCAEEPKKAVVDFSLDYCNRLIGKQIPKDLVLAILQALEIEIEPTADPDRFILQIPTYRVDVTRPCDVVEEILRIYGYNNVEFSNEMHISLSKRGDTDFSNDLQQLISEQLTGNGFNEILNNSLSAAAYYSENEELPLEGCVQVLNPLSQELCVMRRTLMFGGLESISHNINRKSQSLRFYEFGNVYHFNVEKESTDDAPLAPYSESMRLDLWLTGNYTEANWTGKALEADFFQLKGVVLNILTRCGISSSLYTREQDSTTLIKPRLIFKTRGGKVLVEMGQISKKVLKDFDIDQPVMYASINWNELYKLAKKCSVTFKPLPKAQAVTRDMALLLDSSVSFAQVEQCIRKAGGNLLENVELFDVYEGDKLPAGKKSYAVRITLLDPEKTLQDKRTDAVMAKILDAVSKQLGAQQR